MGRFRIDHPDIDVEELEGRIRAAIDAKRGTRFSETDLQRLRAARLEPRPRREDLPRGFLREMSAARSRLPELEAPPGPAPSAAVTVETQPASPVEPAAVGAALFGTGSTGFKGMFLRVLRRIFRPFYRATLNLEHAFEQFRAETVARVERGDDRTLDHVDRTRDRLQQYLDHRIDATTDLTVDWAGRQVSGTIGAAEKRHERELQLLHNLVFELTHARLKLGELEDRLHETRQELALSRERQRTLEAMVLREGDDG